MEFNEPEPEPMSSDEESGGHNFIYTEQISWCDTGMTISTPMSDGSMRLDILQQEKVPVHPDGLRLWRGYMTEKKILNGETPQEKKKENNILNKMCSTSIKDADPNILVKRGQSPDFADESINPE